MTISKPRITTMFTAGTLISAFVLASIPFDLRSAASEAPATPVPPSARTFIEKNFTGAIAFESTGRH